MTISRKFAAFAVKIGIAGGLIYWLFKSGKLDLAPLRDISLDFRTTILLMLAAVAVLAGFALVGWRLCLLLRYKRFSIGFFRVFGLVVIGLFFGVALPGLFSGDIIKAAYLCGNVSERRVDAFASVIVDRAVGLFSLLLLGTLALIAGWITDSVPFESHILLAGPVIVMSFVVVMILLSSDRLFNARSVQAVYLRFPDRLRLFITALRDFLAVPGLLFKVIALSLMNHALLVCVFIASAVVIGETLPALFHFIINPLALVLNVVPLTPGGLGVTESAFALLYQLAGSANGALVGLLGRLILYAVIILTGGVAVSLLRIRSSIPSLADRP